MDFVAHHIVENYIEYIDDQWTDLHSDNVENVEAIETIQAEIRGGSNIYEKNDADFAEIYENVDLTSLHSLITANFLQSSDWKEILRQQKKKLGVVIKKQMEDLQTGVTTWAKFAASLSRTMGSDAPMIAGFLCLTNKVFSIASDMYNQIDQYDGETGEVANQFIERNYTDATIEELHDTIADNIN